MKKILYLNGRKVVYELDRKNVKNINLRIHFDCSVYVSANVDTPINTIEEFLQSKSGYILSALEKYKKISKKVVNKHNYVTGDNFRYLGENLRLVVKKGKRGISFDDECLILSVRNVKDTAQKKRLIDKWYYAQCWDVALEIIGEMYQIFKKYHVAMPNLVLRNMVSRWGICRPKRGLITLNRRLIEAPRNAFEYVVLHEFIHFLYPNHSRNFYNILSRLMPDWKLRKKLLEETVVLAGG